MSSELLFVGTRGYLLAFEKSTGKPAWYHKFKKSSWATGSGFVTILVDGSKVFAVCWGQLYCFETSTGQLLWEDGLSGKGFGIASLAVQGASSSLQPASGVDAAEFQQQQPG